MAVPLGPFMVLTFCLSQAFRDVYFANIFQGLDLFAVIAIAFGLSAITFGFVTAIRSPGDFTKLREHVQTAVAMNVTTALAWTCYFFGLKHLEPSIVNTVHSGMAPLTVVALAAVRIRLLCRCHTLPCRPMVGGNFRSLWLSGPRCRIELAWPDTAVSQRFFEHNQSTLLEAAS